MRCSNDGSSYRPGECFSEDMERFRDEVRGQCEYIPSECSTPDYRILNSEQRDYYFFWRSQLRKGECLRTDEGYVWLFLCEIANLDVQYEEANRELMDLHASCGYLRNRDLIKSVIIDLAIDRNEELPRVWVWGWDFRRYMALSEVMSSPIDPMGLDFMIRLAGNPDVYYERTDDLERLMNLALLRIDRRMTMDTGMGIAETYGKPKRVDHTIYRGLEYYGECADFSITYTDLDNSEFRRFMLGLLRYSEQILFKKENIRGPSAPSAFGGIMRKATEQALDDILDGKGDDMRGPKQSRGTERMRLSAKERMLIDIGRETFGIEDPFSDDAPVDNRPGRMNVDLSSRSQQVSRTFRHDIEANRDARADFEYPYVPSGFTNPDYRSLDDDQRGFYLHWREKVRNGEYPDTDSGYVWLLLCDVINSESDPTEALRIIGGMARAYETDDSDPRSLIRTTYVDYAVSKEVYSIDPSINRSPLTMSMAFTGLLDGSNEIIEDRETFLDVSGVSTKTMRDDFDRDCCGIVGRVLVKMDRMLSGKGGICGYCGITTSVMRVRPFTRLRYYGDKPKGIVEFIDYPGNREFRDSLLEIVRCVIAHIRRRKGRRVTVPQATAFGMECGGLIANEVASWFDPSLKAVENRSRDIVLDPKAIGNAENDLKQVTEMMMTSENMESGYENVHDDVNTSDYDDPWTAFAQSLTGDEIVLLRDLVLGRTTTADPRTVDSINSKAMDSVGDTVIEDGSLIPDYMTEVADSLGRLP